MYWWSIEKLANNLAHNTYVRSDTFLFWLLNILLTACQSVVYTSLLFSSLIVEYHFKDWLPTQHALLDTYHALGWCFSILNSGIALTAIGYCYYQHKKNNGINFWQRFSALNSSIGFHILIYSTTLLFISLSVLYIVIHLKIEAFKSTIISTEAPTDFFSRIFSNPFSSITTPQTASKGFFGSLISMTGTILSLPFLPGRIIVFLEELRDFIMRFYPIVAVLPTLLLVTQYTLVNRWFSYINQQTPKK